MAPTALIIPSDTTQESPVDPKQILRASTALLRKLQPDPDAPQPSTAKPSLLDDADDNEASDATPIWLILTTKKHVADRNRLKPGKILLPHPYLDPASTSTLRICLITADPQRTYKDLIAEPTFPLALSQHISRVIGITKLKAKYKSYESRRHLLAEHDVFLADDRIITQLPQVLGKTFYKGGAKRPIPISLEGKRQSVDEHGTKRRKLSEGGSKVSKAPVAPAAIANEISRTLASALVHLAPSTTTAVKVGIASQAPTEISTNISAVVNGLVDRYVPQKWPNVRAIHIKGPNTVALPIWLADELWAEEADVLDQPLPLPESKKRKRAQANSTPLLSATSESHPPAILEIPGPDGKMRRLENPAAVKTRAAKKGSKGDVGSEEAAAVAAAAAAEEKEHARLDKAARKAALKQQKDVAKDEVALKGKRKKEAKVEA